MLHKVSKRTMSNNPLFEVFTRYKIILIISILMMSYSFLHACCSHNMLMLCWKCRHRRIVQYKTAYYSFYLPVSEQGILHSVQLYISYVQFFYLKLSMPDLMIKLHYLIFLLVKLLDCEYSCSISAVSRNLPSI